MTGEFRSLARLLSLLQEISLQVDGTRVYGRYWPAKKPKGSVLLLHGFGSCLLEFGDLPDRLAQAGFASLAIDMRGHGLSAGERGRIGLQRALADAAVATHWLKEKHPGLPVTLVGHSLGGAYALGLAAREDAWNALVVAHPPRNIFEELSAAEKALYHVAGRVGRRRMARGKPAGYLPRKTQYRHLFVDRDAMQAAKAERFLQEKVNLGNYTFAITMDAEAWAEQVQIPVLGITSDQDQIVRPRIMDDVLEAIPDSRIVRHQGGHSCFRDLDRDAITHAIIDFLEEMS